MRIKEIEARLAAIKKEIEERGDAMKAEELSLIHILWDKGQRGLSMSDCELAYTSFDTPTRIFTLNRVELQIEGTIHPTQKPVSYTHLLPE